MAVSSTSRTVTRRARCRAGMAGFLAKRASGLVKEQRSWTTTSSARSKQAIADLGTLLVQMDKFRAGAADEARDPPHGLPRDRRSRPPRAPARRARRHARRGARRRRGRGARARLERWLAGGPRSPAHRRRRRRARRAATTPRFAPRSPALFAGVEASRRRRPSSIRSPGSAAAVPRPAADVAAELVRLRADGLAGRRRPRRARRRSGASGRASCPRRRRSARRSTSSLRDAARPAWALVLDASGDVVVPGVGSRAPFAVGLADPDDDELDEWTLDPAALSRRELAAAIARTAVPTDAGDVAWKAPATPSVGPRAPRENPSVGPSPARQPVSRASSARDRLAERARRRPSRRSTALERVDDRRMVAPAELRADRLQAARRCAAGRGTSRAAAAPTDRAVRRAEAISVCVRW